MTTSRATTPPSLKVTAGLRLLYGFAPTPNPVRASAMAASPAMVDLEIVVEPTLAPALMSKIEITIPVGEDDAAYLSSDPDLPDPEYDTTLPWTIASEGSTVTLVPASGDAIKVTSAVAFTLRRIPVNDRIGVVPVTITEFPAAPAPKTTDATTYRIEKLAKDFPVTDFHADPSVLSDVDQPVTLYWACTADAANLSFGAYAEDGSWSSGDCLNGGNCLSPSDGTNGVQTAPVASVQPAQYALDVVTTDPSGNRTLLKTLHTTVRVDRPQFVAHHLNQTLSGQLVHAGWLAVNATSCTLRVDGQPVDADAPNDTYQHGYPLWLAGAGAHQISVEALDRTGQVQDSVVFPDVWLRGPVTPIQTNWRPWDIAMTPDCHYVFVAIPGDDSGGSGRVDLLDTITCHYITTLLTGPTPMSLALANLANAPVVLLTSVAVQGVTVFSGKYPFPPEPRPIPLETLAGPVAASADGTRAVVAAVMQPKLLLIDVAARSQVASIALPDVPVGAAVSADGAFAVAAGQSKNLHIVRLKAPYTVTTVPVGQDLGPGMVAITPDGAFALVTLSRSNQVALVNVRKGTIEPQRLAVGAEPVCVAITPDGRLALVGNYADGTVSVIDLPTRTVAPFTIGAVQPTAIAIDPKATCAVALSRDQSVATRI